MNGMRNKLSVLVILASLAAALIASTALADSGAQVTNGDFQTFAAGPGRGYEISGHAQMVRTADGKTLTMVKAVGLKPDNSYPAHVHNAPCAVNNGGGHYQDVVGGTVDNANEIWPGFTTNANGNGSGYAANDFTARPEAQSVVIHDSDGSGARIACADLK